MERIDELTLKLLDELATPAEEAELAKLLEESADARERHVALAEVEAALRAGGLPASVADDAVAQIRSESGADLERTVMRHIGALPIPAWAQPTTGTAASRTARGWRRNRWMAMAALAAAVAVAALVSLPWSRRDSRHPPTALVLGVSGQAEWVGETTLTAELAEGDQFPAHRSLRLIGDDSTVRLQYPDGTRLDLIGPAQFTLALSPAGGKLVLLTGGGLKADVRAQRAGQPMLVVTPQAEVRVLGTAFELLAGEDATRVDLEHGRIELVRNTEPPVVVEPGSIAVITTGDAPIVVVPRPAREAAPAGFEFRDLQTAWFTTAADPVRGEEPLVGLTRWQAVYAHGGRLEAIPFSSFDKKGVERETQAGPIVAFAEDRTYRTVLWNAETRQEVGALDWRSLPRSDEAPVRVSVLAVSPQGDWLAVRPAGAKSLESYDIHHLAAGVVLTLSGSQKISAFAASPDGRTLAVGRRSIGRSTGNFIELVDVATGEVRRTLAVERSHPLSLAFSANGGRIAVGLTGEVQVWTTDTAEMLASIRVPGVPFTRLALSADGSRLAANGHQIETVWLWQIPAQAGQEIELPTAQVSGQTRSLAFSPAGRLAVLNHKGHVCVWQVAAAGSKEPQQ